MSGKFLADTNAFIYLLQKNSAIKSLLNAEWQYCFITEIELLGKPSITPSEQRLIKSMLYTVNKLAHQDAINEIAISLKQKHSIKTPDAIIGATSIYYDPPLLTADKSFGRLSAINVMLIEL